MGDVTKAQLKCKARRNGAVGCYNQLDSVKVAAAINTTDRILSSAVALSNFRYRLSNGRPSKVARWSE